MQYVYVYELAHYSKENEPQSYSLHMNARLLHFLFDLPLMRNKVNKEEATDATS